MSSLDSQVLSIGTMFTQDIVRHYRGEDGMSERRQVLYGRLFVAAVLVVTFLLAQVADRSIFKLAVWSFTGFASLFPVVLAALFWRRSTKTGAFASIVSVVLLWTWFFSLGWETPGYTVGGSGVMPVAVILAVSAVAMVAGSLLTRPPAPEVLRRFFPDAGGP